MLSLPGSKIIVSRDIISSYFNNGISVRRGRYRLTKYSRNEEPVIELYDQRNDPVETNNIAFDEPKIVNELMPILEKGSTRLYE